MLQINGFKKISEVKEEEKLKPRICLFCGTSNDSTNRICSNPSCNQLLDQKEIIEREKVRSEFEGRFFKLLPFFEKVEKLSNNPNFLRMLEKP